MKSGRPPRRRETAKDEQLARFQEPREEDAVLSTDQGVKLPHTDDALKAGPRGPTLMEDFHFREKLTRFDHERIPERVVHARGSGAHGHFQVYASLEDLTRARFLCDPSLRTPVFVRFSTVVGSRGSADTVRDVRGFATKFYTEEGNFDLVGNNMPVFFIQDGVKFPDLVHAIKPEPRHEMPQASSAHDTFWDFVSLTPETLHMVMWLMSDRGIPRSYRMMEGFGVHTFRLVNARGKAHLCKFHWKPLLGAHALAWDEAQKLAGKDPDYHRRDLWEAIEQGDFPEYELGLQVVAEEDELSFGFDLLDATKLLPEELVPVRRVGRLVLDRNPDNFFAETEQVAFHIGNVVPGIDFTNDPLLQARLFSYLDTQLLRLGGPNFHEIPINRPLAPVRNHQQDGFHRSTIHTARALYHPNSIEEGRPRLAREGEGYEHYAERVDGRKIRARSDSFKDHFSQARLFLHSQSPPERQHLAEALQFEVGKVTRPEIRERVVALLRNVDENLAAEVGKALGLTVLPKEPDEVEPGQPSGALLSSPALSLENQPTDDLRTRKLAVLAADGVEGEEVEGLRRALQAEGVRVEIVAPALGKLRVRHGADLEVDHTLATSGSVFFDAVYVPGGLESVTLLEGKGEAVHFVREAFHHGKPVGATGDGVNLISAAALPGVKLSAPGGVAQGRRDPTVQSDKGVVSAAGADMAVFAAELITAMKKHRHFDRAVKVVPA